MTSQRTAAAVDQGTSPSATSVDEELQIVDSLDFQLVSASHCPAPVVREIAGFLDGGAFFELDFAFATITAGRAALADVIGAGVLGADRTNTGGFFTADTTVERHD